MLLSAHCGNHAKYEIVANCGQNAVLSCEYGCAHGCNVQLFCTQLVTYLWFYYYLVLSHAMPGVAKLLYYGLWTTYVL